MLGDILTYRYYPVATQIIDSFIAFRDVKSVLNLYHVSRDIRSLVTQRLRRLGEVYKFWNAIFNTEYLCLFLWETLDDEIMNLIDTKFFYEFQDIIFNKDRTFFYYLIVTRKDIDLKKFKRNFNMDDFLYGYLYLMPESVSFDFANRYKDVINWRSYKGVGKVFTETELGELINYVDVHSLLKSWCFRKVSLKFLEDYQYSLNPNDILERYISTEFINLFFDRIDHDRVVRDLRYYEMQLSKFIEIPDRITYQMWEVTEQNKQYLRKRYKIAVCKRRWKTSSVTNHNVAYEVENTSSLVPRPFRKCRKLTPYTA